MTPEFMRLTAPKWDFNTECQCTHPCVICNKFDISKNGSRFICGKNQIERYYQVFFLCFKSHRLEFWDSGERKTFYQHDSL